MEYMVLENLNRYLIIQIIFQKTEYIARLEFSRLGKDVLWCVFTSLGLVLLIACAFERKQADLFDFIE